MKYFLLVMLCMPVYASQVNYQSSHCNRLEMKNNRRKELIVKIQDIQKKMLSLLNSPHARKHIKRTHYIKKVKQLNYKKKMLLLSLSKFKENYVMQGCPLIWNNYFLFLFSPVRRLLLIYRRREILPKTNFLRSHCQTTSSIAV